MPKETNVEGSNPMSISLAELKEKNITDLAKIAKDLNIPGASGMRKQELIFQILRAQTEKNGLIFSELPSTTTFPAPTIFTSRLRRFANSISALAIRFPARYVRPKMASVISP